MRRALLLFILTLTACGPRTLTPNEVALLAPLHGETLDTSRVAIGSSRVVGAFPITYDNRPRVTCRERISPPDPRPRITARTGGIVLFERLFLAPDLAFPDFAAEYDGALDLPLAMFLVHEMTHVWQWQNRAVTGYNPARAFREQIMLDDPYLFEDARKPFLDFGYEAQASIVEEYLCCATLDPNGARTGRLFDLLREVMPVAEPRTFPRRVTVPWGEDLAGICA